ncbi:ABC transporter substrate-binding protein [Robertmurraya yapensis]|uniref:ABC transporter substrate-binding protein n=2 Tax=Bacillaceae TaxID=186817 RepID=A0A3S0KWQ7_9BACI|nr:ABC transporter substrate-binding protein [Bacillus yapensis]RTR36078.1 ABC transporter substrate-binding protein [Bacillus yapensis]TKT05581.1 ABC transporter substrate-binding protein [Bacillus yapensis]
MKKISKLLMTSVLFAGVLAGCASGNETTGGSDGGGDTIKIGANLELSGAVASYGEGIKEGIDLAIEEINAAGGVDGKELEVVPVDNKSEGSEATNAAIKLVNQDKVTAIIGSATSGNTKAQTQIADEGKTILITPSGTADDLTLGTDGNVIDYVFRTSFIDSFQGKVAANFATDLGIKNAAIYADNASDYAKGLAKSFKETFEAAGGKVVAEESYMADDTDFRSTLTNLKSAEPEFIFIPGYYEEVGLIVKQARELGIDVPLMGADGWDSPTLVELAGAENLNNTYITNHYSSGDPDETIQKFVEAFSKKYDGAKPDAFNALGYDSVYLLVDAMDRAGTTTDKEKIKDALAETKDLSLITGKITIDELHNPTKSATVLEYKNGEQVFKSKVNP